MRAVIQLVDSASVTVQDRTTGKIAKGLLVLLGICEDDTRDDAFYLAEKISNLRIFQDAQGLMNLSVKDVRGSVLVVSQFTLFGDCRKGRRPSYSKAAPPEKAESLYEYFSSCLEEKGLPVEKGEFRAMMKVSLVNNGPVTLLMDSNKTF